MYITYSICVYIMCNAFWFTVHKTVGSIKHIILLCYSEHSQKNVFVYYFLVCSQIHNAERSSGFLCGTNINKDNPTSMTQQENGGQTQQLKIKCCDDGAREGDKQLMMLYKARHIIDIQNSNTHLQTKTMRQRTSGETLLGLVSSGTLTALTSSLDS